MRQLLTILFTLGLATAARSQTGVLIPEIINYSKKAYSSGNQNRGIDRDRRGLFYFANDDGLLVFDGNYWKTYPLPNGSIVRSLTVVDDRIYIGGQQDFGYFEFDPKGSLVYTSLKPSIPAGETDFTDVWRVIPYGPDIFFQSNKRLFRYHDGTITAYRSINWSFLAACRGLLIAQQYEGGLMVFKDTGWVRLPGNRPEFARDKMGIRSLTAFSSSGILMGTQKMGCYLMDKDSIRKFEPPTIAAINHQIIQSLTTIDTNEIVVGTRLDGYYVVNTKMEILQHITKKEGLQSSTINTVYVDGEKNLWLGLNNGIDLIIYNSAINHITPSLDNRGPGYSAALYDKKLFLGTGFGLFSMPLPADNELSGMQKGFGLVQNSNGIVWGLSVVNNQLLMGKNDGAFVVAGNVATALDSTNGFWFFQPLTAMQPSPRVIAGTYSGVNIYNYVNGKFVNPKLNTRFESAKYTVVSGDEIWTVHPYQGLYKISFNDTGAPVSKAYRDVHGLLSSGHNHLFKIQNKIVLVTRKGIFEYDHTLGDFIESAFFKRVLGSVVVSYLREDTQGNIWFIEDKKPGVIDLSGDKPVVVYFSELNNSVLGNDEEFIYPINKNNILVAGEIGFYHINYEKYRATNRPMRLLLRTVTAFHEQDSILFGGYLFRKDSSQLFDAYDFGRTIRYKWNSLHFEYSSPYFGEFVEYSCRLNGYEREWSSWSRRTERSYTNLPAGNYIFEVVARTSNGRQSAVSLFKFTISPPWYNTVLAWVVYILLAIAIIYWFYKRQQRKYIQQHTERLRKQREKFDEEQKRLQYLHQLEIEKNEKEIIRLKNIQLETEVEHNNVELASNTMNLLQKRELMNKIKDEILKVQEEEEPEKRVKSIRRIIKIINEQLELSDDWERFSQYFDKSNNDFLKTLRDNYPLLTPSDLKLCAYLRLNLSTKAIADLLNLSIRGVESSRYRLRKKLSLGNDVSLSDFLLNISP